MSTHKPDALPGIHKALRDVVDDILAAGRITHADMNDALFAVGCEMAMQAWGPARLANRLRVMADGFEKLDVPRVKDVLPRA